MAMGIWLPGGGGGDFDAITAGAGDVLAGKVILDSEGEPLTGTMPERGSWNSSELAAGASVTIPGGHHSGSGKVTAKSLSAQTSGTATAAQILSGKTAWVNGSEVTGSMANRGNYGGTGNSRGNDASGQRMWVKVPGGYYNENAQVFLNWADIRSMAGLTPDKIKKDVSIMGITGSWEGYVKSPLYLYNKGTWSGLQTTGMTAVNLGAGVYLQEKDGSIGFASRNRPDSPSSNARLNQTFNLSSYKYIKVNANCYKNYALIGVSTSGNAGIGQYTASARSSNDGYIILDVSSLSGNYYIYFEGSSLNGYIQTQLVVSFNELIVTNN